METEFVGKAWTFGDHIDTDMIVPGKFLQILEPAGLAKIVLHGADPEFAAKVRPGDLLVAGINFGCGSSREHAPVALKAAGIPVVLAESFARIFFRNAINIGYPVLEVPGIHKGVTQGDQLSVDLATGAVKNLTTGATFRAKPLPPNILQILDAGGLAPLVAREIAAQKH